MFLRAFGLAISLFLQINLALCDLVPFEMPSLLYDNTPEGQITFDVVDYNHEDVIQTMCSATTPADDSQVTFPSEEVSETVCCGAILYPFSIHFPN